MRKVLSRGAVLVSAVLGLSACSSAPPHPRSEHFDGERFFNVPAEPPSASPWLIWWRLLTAPRPGSVPAQALPVQPLAWADWAALPADDVHVVRLGHSSLLLKLHGQQWLVDPVWSERASPVSFAGPSRFHPVPIDVDSLPEMDGLILSHDHYDHLDADTLARIHPKVARFVTTLGVGARLQALGVPAAKITELDWTQSVAVGSLRITATPSQHFSGRSLFDRNRTLWASWVIDSRPAGLAPRKLFFSGDSGYFPGFRRIGEQHGPFDLTLVETGAWNDMWPGMHMTPEESVQAHLDLRGQVMMPVHNGTFELAFHPWAEPFERVSRAAKQQGVRLATPVMGQVMSLGGEVPQPIWWAGLR